MPTITFTLEVTDKERDTILSNVLKAAKRSEPKLVDNAQTESTDTPIVAEPVVDEPLPPPPVSLEDIMKELDRYVKDSKADPMSIHTLLNEIYTRCNTNVNDLQTNETARRAVLEELQKC